MLTTRKLIIASQVREVGYLNFEFDDLVDDIVANLPLQKHILSDWRRIDDSRFNISKLDFSLDCLTIHSITKKASIFFVVISPNHSVKIT